MAGVRRQPRYDGCARTLTPVVFDAFAGTSDILQPPEELIQPDVTPSTFPSFWMSCQAERLAKNTVVKCDISSQHGADMLRALAADPCTVGLVFGEAFSTATRFPAKAWKVLVESAVVVATRGLARNDQSSCIYAMCSSLQPLFLVWTLLDVQRHARVHLAIADWPRLTSLASRSHRQSLWSPSNHIVEDLLGGRLVHIDHCPNIVECTHLRVYPSAIAEAECRSVRFGGLVVVVVVEVAVVVAFECCDDGCCFDCASIVLHSGLSTHRIVFIHANVETIEEIADPSVHLVERINIL
eukprot:3091147-Amphidinium_carterae.2